MPGSGAGGSSAGASSDLRVPAFDRLRLMPFPLPDFVCNAKQFVDTLRNGKQTTIVVGENDIVGFDQEVTKACGTQRRGITRVEPSRAGTTCPIAENGQTNLPELWRIAMHAPDYDSSQTAVLSLERS